jgi:PPOX class probable F420-dependent enzyme
VTFAIDTSTEFGARAARRLLSEPIMWLVTVDANGAPVPSPVWFLWDDGEVLVYSRPGTRKLRNIEANSRVALHLDSADDGEDIVVLSGRARIDSGQPPSNEVEAYMSKYSELVARLGWEPAGFAADYSVAVRIEPLRLRGF